MDITFSLLSAEETEEEKETAEAEWDQAQKTKQAKETFGGLA